jgi:hypothetical protein
MLIVIFRVPNIYKSIEVRAYSAMGNPLLCMYRDKYSTSSLSAGIGRHRLDKFSLLKS